eukprot:2844716-Rhodomonas_salina.2
MAVLEGLTADTTHPQSSSTPCKWIDAPEESARALSLARSLSRPLFCHRSLVHSPPRPPTLPPPHPSGSSLRRLAKRRRGRG